MIRRLFLLSIIILAGGCGVRTVTGEHFAQIHFEQQVASWSVSWTYFGSDDEYHYVAIQGDQRPRYRVPVRDLFIVNERPSVQGLVTALKDHAPDLYPARWYPNNPPPRDAFVDGYRLLPENAASGP